jgi:CubicO group peptidase (beta-lactamase class C family)
MQATAPNEGQLQQRLQALLGKFSVPGAAAGVLLRGEITVAAAGVTRNDAEGVPITGDTLFLLGSIAKVWTATLVMQLLDEGRLGLDDPVNRHLSPPLRLAEDGAADAVTVRQLLTHTAGFYGDREDPDEHGDDALKRTVASYHDLPQLHRPGTLFSYSNAGYNVLGRLVECLTGDTWDTALQERLLTPLGLERTFTQTRPAMVHRVAIGHDSPDGKQFTPVDVWCDSRSTGPCGGTLATRVADLLSFARAHLGDGQAPDAARILSAKSAQLMRQEQVRMADPALGHAWGLGWEITRATDPLVIGHGGNTNGQMSQVYLVPEHDLAVGVLTNGDVTGQLREAMCDELLSDLVGVCVADRPTAAADGANPDATSLLGLVGTYGRDDIQFTFRDDESGLVADVVTNGKSADELAPFSTPLRYVEDTRFLFTIPGFEEIPQPLTFVWEQDRRGPATHIALGGRVLPRRTPGQPFPVSTTEGEGR